jgi:alanine racemase
MLTPKHNQLLVDLQSIKKNIDFFKSLLPKKTRLLAVLKANAYGTNAVYLSKYLFSWGIDIISVADVNEGIYLRKQGVKQEILVAGTLPEEIPFAAHYNLQIGISNFLTLLELLKLAKTLKSPIKVHLQINTGMNRFGFSYKEAIEAAHKISAFPHVKFEGVMSHFSSAHIPEEDTFSKQQISSFLKFKQNLQNSSISPKWWHLANSSGALRFKLPELNMVRIGIGLLGINPSRDESLDKSFTPALKLSSRIIHLQTCHEGDSISYGRLHRIKAPEARIAVLPIGYADGLHLNYGKQASVTINNQQAPIVGAICMDTVMVDVTHIPNVHLGDEAVLFGPPPFTSAQQFSSWGNTIPYELITCLSARIERTFYNTELYSPKSTHPI